MHKGLILVGLVTAGLLAGCGGGGGGGSPTPPTNSNPTTPACTGTQCTSFSGTATYASAPAPQGTPITGTNPANGAVCAAAFTDDSAGDYVMALTELEESATYPSCANVSGLLIAATWTVGNGPPVTASTTCYLGQSTPCNLSGSTATQIAQFQGQWNATYTGGDQGSCTIDVASSGAVKQSQCQSTVSGRQPFTLSGVLTPSSSDPYQGLFAGNASTGATYQGTFVLNGASGSVSDGQWSNVKTSPVQNGTWAATMGTAPTP
jgi:hypothetical protein